VERLQAAIADINQRNVDAVLFAGDLTKDGAVSEFHRVDELLADLQPPFVAIPGNHDVPKPSLETHRTPPIESFVRRYTGGHLPFVERIGGVDLVGLNSATAADGSLDDTHGGYVSESQLTWLADVLPSLECPVVAVHHNLTRRGDGGASTSADIWQLDNAREVATVLENCGVSLVLAGHIHCSAVGAIAGIREVIIPATCSFPQAYGLVHVGPEGTEIELVPLADEAGLKEAWDLVINDGREQVLTSTSGPYPIVDEYSHREDGTQNSITRSGESRLD
jgi:3',5'-cyclic AMP phosphodiesterase CpdA